MSLQEKLQQEYEELARTTSRPNILIAGATGAGKSSLVNLVFGKELARAGIGRPVTKHLQRLETPSVPLVLFDTVGYGVDADIHPETINEITAFAAGRNQKDVGERVHLVWYVIDASRSRVLDIDMELCRRLCQERLPTAVVLSKCDLVSKTEIGELASIIRDALPGTAIFAVTAKDVPGLGHLEVSNLCEWSFERLPEALKYAFIKSQRVNLRGKHRAAASIILQHVLANFGVGWIPLPFSDAFLLMPSQVAMTARLLYLYDMNESLGALKGIVATPVVSALGVMTAANLLKCFPGIGTVVGGLINGSVAATITGAMGLAITVVCEQAVQLALSGREAELTAYLENMEQHFGDVLRNCYERAKGGDVRKLLREEQT